MRTFSSSPNRTARGGVHRALGLAALGLLLGALVWPVSAGQQQQLPAAIVGRLYGDDVKVQGAVSFETENGLSTALLASGSDVTVRTGRAQIALTDGGDIAICGPAHFTVLESGGAVTLALDYGRVRPQVEANVQLTVYTPMIVATPVAIGQDPRDLTVGLDRDGAMCAVTQRGALRVEQQLSGQSVLLPQGGEIDLNGGQLNTLRAASGSCDCELLVTRNAAPKKFELSVPVPRFPTRPQATALPPPPRAEQPIYRVYVPPLTFDASEPAPPPDPDPANILMLREEQPLAQPVVAGNDEPTLQAASDYVPPQPASPPQPSAAKIPVPAAKPRHGNIFARIFGVFHHSHSPCVGSGCDDSGN